MTASGRGLGLAFLLLAGCGASLTKGSDAGPVCAASGASCAASSCCANPSDYCLAQGSDKLCVIALSPPVDAGGCNGLASSDLPGVSFTFPDQPCSYTAAQVAAGIEIAYQEQIAQPLSELRPSQWDDGRCQMPDDAGLIVGYEISGSGEIYCRCDVGLCPAQTFVTAAVAGTHDRQIPWDGRNWDGPSDTGNPEGAPFPPGTYTLSLTATGTRADSPDASASAATPFTITATRFVTITP